MNHGTRPSSLRTSCLGLAWTAAVACSGSGIRGETGTSDGAFPTGNSSSVGTQGGGTDGGAPSDGATGGGGASSGPATSGDGTGGGGVKFDVGDDGAGSTGGGDGGGDDACGCNSQSRHNYIWVSNSQESTISKINTATVVEEGRYLTRPDGQGSPSRTSVTISGRAVAVANRRGGVTKFWSNRVNCIDRNANGQIDTSTGPADVLPWGEDECMAWHTPLDYSSNRPVAWTCHNNKEMLWTGGSGRSVPDPDAHILLLDGDTGAITQTVVAANYGGGLGPYGGAVDSAGNFWTSPMGFFTADEPEFHRLHRVDAISFVHESYPMDLNIQSYGITVDKFNYVWLTSLGTSYVGRFTPSTQTWDVIPGPGSNSGIAEGPDGRVWYGGNGVQFVDPNTLVVHQLLSGSASGIGSIKGVALDSGGFVWIVDTVQAYKVDPAAAQVAATYTGLTGPYTYSDMTGWNVQNTVGCLPPPPG